MSLPPLECVYLTEEALEELKIVNSNFKFPAPAPILPFLSELCQTMVRGDLPYQKCKVVLEAVEFSDCGPKGDVGSFFADIVAQMAQDLTMLGEYRSRLIKLAKWLVESALVPLRFFQERCDEEFLRESEMIKIKAADLKSTEVWVNTQRLEGPMQLIQRPGFGKIGEKSSKKSISNHFLVDGVSSHIQAYSVSFWGDDDKNHRFNIWKSAKINLEGGQFAFYDGDVTVYRFGEMQSFDKWTGGVYSVQARDSTICGVKLHFMSDNIHDQVTKALNAMMREMLHRSHIVVEPFFGFRPLDEQNREWVKNGVVAFQGFSQNACQTQKGLTLNIDTAAEAFFQCVKISELVSALGFNLGFPLSDNDRIQVEQLLVGIVVKTDEFPSLKIEGLTISPEQDLVFKMDDALKWSDDRLRPYADAEDETLLGVGLVSASKFFLIHNLHTEHKALPVLCVNRTPFRVPMEQCTILPEQHYSHLNDYENKSLVEIFDKGPKKRLQDIKKVVKRLYRNGGNSLDMHIAVHMSSNFLRYRVIPCPKLKYKEGTTTSWNKEMYDAKHIHNGWACINFSKLKLNAVDKFCRHVISVCSEFGMVMSTTSLFSTSMAPLNFEKFVRSKKKLRSKIDDGTLRLLVIILPDESNEYYGLINKACDMRLGIVTECCQPSKVAQCQADYMEDLALKINVKLGGQNAVLETRELFEKNRFLIDGKGSTLFFGVTICYPTPRDDSTSSIVGVVASVNWPELSRYKTVFSKQPSKEKTIKPSVLKLLVRRVLGGSHVSRPVARIIVFWDGSRERQNNVVFENEANAIKEMCTSVDGCENAKVTFVVVQDAHHTLFFDINNKKIANVAPGAVVDTDICHPTGFDFYLCSHRTSKGSSLPTYYSVLRDDNGFTADGLQLLTNTLCYTYAVDATPVSTVPPILYSRLVAERVCNYGGGTQIGTEIEFHSNLGDRLFYC